MKRICNASSKIVDEPKIINPKYQNPIHWWKIPKSELLLARGPFRILGFHINILSFYIWKFLFSSCQLFSKKICKSRKKAQPQPSCEFSWENPCISDFLNITTQIQMITLSRESRVHSLLLLANLKPWSMHSVAKYTKIFVCNLIGKISIVLHMLEVNPNYNR